MTSVPSWVAALGIVAPPVAGLLGYLLAGRNEAARDARAETREEQARRAARVERQEDRKHDFQRDLLLDLQDRILAMIRGTAKVVMFDLGTLKEHGQMTQLPEDMNAETYDAGVAFSRAVVRVLDDDLRTRLEDFHTQVSAVELLGIRLRNAPPDRARTQLNTALNRLTESYTSVNERLGAALRAELGG